MKTGNEEQSNNILESKKKIFLNLINFLNIKKINYCVLSHELNFSEKIISDIDLFVDFKNNKLLYKLIDEFCLKNKLKIFRCYQHEINSFFFVVVYQDQLGKFQFIHLDICNEYIVNNRRILKFDNLENKTLFKLENIKFRTLNPEFGLTYYLIKKIFKLNIQNKHFDYIYSQSDQIKNLHSSEITKYFSNSISLKIVDALKNKDNEFFINNLLNLKKDVLRFRPIKLKDIISLVKLYFSRILKPNGLFVVFLGCDGSGKSVVVNKISEILKKNASFRIIKQFHFAPTNKYQNKNANILNPHSKKSYNFLISFIKLIYLYFVNLLGYFFNIWPVITKSGLIIFDRFFYDINVDPKRYRIKLPLIFIRFISFLLPKPDFVFILDATSEEIYNRKKELDLDVLQDLKLKYLKLENKFNNTYVIDNSENIDKTLKSIIKIMTNYKF